MFILIQFRGKDTKNFSNYQIIFIICTKKADFGNRGNLLLQKNDKITPTSHKNELFSIALSIGAIAWISHTQPLLGLTAPQFTGTTYLNLSYNLYNRGQSIRKCIVNLSIRISAIRSPVHPFILSLISLPKLHKLLIIKYIVRLIIKLGS